MANIWMLTGALIAHERVESQITTRSGKLERVLYSEDERQFGVRLTKPNQEILWLEEPSEKISSSTRTVRERSPSLWGDKIDAVYEISERGAKLLGFSPRTFESDGEFHCSVLARFYYPTPLDEPRLYSLNELKCFKPDEETGPYPLTESRFFQVVGQGNQNWVNCKPDEAYCHWLPRYPSELEASAQVSTFGFLWRARGEFLMAGIEFYQEPIIAKSMAYKSNRSVYDADTRTISLGTGKYPDGLDGFIVVHEWTHSVIDDLNRGLYGSEAQVLHEGIADYWAAQLFDSPCFAHFDAQEVPDRKCVRKLDQDLHYPQDMHGDPHVDSMVLSSALWELKSILPPTIVLEMIGESLIRLPKAPTLIDFWAKMTATYERMLDERVLLLDRRSEVHAMLRRRGFEH